MFLSIIIPVYNVEPYLRECLDSIAASSLDCWEAILIDDGSTDKCPLICDEYAARDKRFRVIHQKNGGVSSARNAGLDVARGEWIWFVDSDDIVDMQHVRDILHWLEGNSNVDLVMFDIRTFNDGDNVWLPDMGSSEPLVIDDSLAKNEFLLKHICYHHPRLWYKRGWLAHHPRPLRFTEGIRLAEDLEFQYKYLTHCMLPVKVDYALYFYRLRSGSATGDQRYRSNAVEDLPKVLKNLARWAAENAVSPEPWFDYRIVKLVQNLLYSASLAGNLDINELQQKIRTIIKQFDALGFKGFKSLKMRIAYWNIRCYFLINRFYLKIKGI